MPITINHVDAIFDYINKGENEKFFEHVADLRGLSFDAKSN